MDLDTDDIMDIFWNGAFVTKKDFYKKDNNDLKGEFFMGPGIREISAKITKKGDWVINKGIFMTEE